MQDGQSKIQMVGDKHINTCKKGEVPEYPTKPTLTKLCAGARVIFCRFVLVDFVLNFFVSHYQHYYLLFTCP